ncbi:MAG TPA: ATP-binding protein [Candidatus Limnocylindrales bacterium]|nr:ATP-binding protein [Candidatus Limnocylindrales bacterium]
MLVTLLDKLPTILVLAVLVGIFVALRRHARSVRLNLWVAAWGLIFCHFLSGIFYPADGSGSPLVLLADQGALQLAAFFFIASLTAFHEDRRLTRAFLVTASVPAVLYIALLAFGYEPRGSYIAGLALLFFGVPLLIARARKPIWQGLVWAPVVIGVGAWAIVEAWSGNYVFGWIALLTVTFALPALLYWRRYPRWSPGVITTVGGFGLWSSVFPVGVLVGTYVPNLKINPELWNVPKFFVAFGMILTLLEEKSSVLRAAGVRERKINDQMRRFAEITSRMLTGADFSALAQEIAQAICDTTTFRRVCIVLSADGRTLYPAGCAGMDEEAMAQVAENCRNWWQLEHVVEIFRRGARIGETSCIVPAEALTEYKLSVSKLDPPAGWSKGTRVFIPLQTLRGSYIGCIALDDPCDMDRVNAEEMSRIELLAGDLAVILDNEALHRQLVRSEKLAAMGQLVAGVAHELNNPLTSIVGYSELMTDEVAPGPARQKLEKMIREAQRMKRIIENLLRFARQNNLEKKSANLQDLLQDVLALREYHIQNHDIELRLHLEPDLPLVALDEDQFKQILLNLLNNSMDALEACEHKAISITAKRRGDRVVLHFDDNGPGFSDPNRVFDPFYTTKPVGKGTGLGLSICYGIVKEHGGDVHAVNLSPGARIALELPMQAMVGFDEPQLVS